MLTDLSLDVILNLLCHILFIKLLFSQTIGEDYCLGLCWCTFKFVVVVIVVVGGGGVIVVGSVVVVVYKFLEYQEF